MSGERKNVVIVPVLTPPRQVPVFTPPTMPLPSAAAPPPMPATSEPATADPAPVAASAPAATSVAAPASPAPAPPAGRDASPPPLEPFALASSFAPLPAAASSSATPATPDADGRAEAASVRAPDVGAVPPSRFLTPSPPPAPVQSSPSAAEQLPALPGRPILPRYGPPATEPAAALPATTPLASSTPTAPAAHEEPTHEEPPPAAPALPAARGLRWWRRLPLRIGRGVVQVSAGSICCLGWIVAIYAGVAAHLPPALSLAARITLLVMPPLSIALVCTVLGRGVTLRLAPALAALLVGVLPALLLPPPGGLDPSWLARAPLLTPGLSAGVAVGFGWPPPVDPSPRTTPWAIGMRAAGLAALGYGLAIVALLMFEVYAALTFARPCPGPSCYTQVLTWSYVALVEVFAAIFGSILVLVGGAFGALLRDR